MCLNCLPGFLALPPSFKDVGELCLGRCTCGCERRCLLRGDGHHRPRFMRGISERGGGGEAGNGSGSFNEFTNGYKDKDLCGYIVSADNVIQC